MSLYARLAALAIVVLAVAGLWWKADRMLAAREAVGYQRRVAEDAAAAELQREGNRGRTRAVEEKYTPAAQVRERFIVTTIKEVRNATDSLAACPLGPDAVRLLNAAAACARDDRPASCGAGVELPRP